MLASILRRWKLHSQFQRQKWMATPPNLPRKEKDASQEEGSNELGRGYMASRTIHHPKVWTVQMDVKISKNSSSMTTTMQSVHFVEAARNPGNVPRKKLMAATLSGNLQIPFLLRESLSVVETGCTSLLFFSTLAPMVFTSAHSVWSSRKISEGDVHMLLSP